MQPKEREDFWSWMTIKGSTPDSIKLQDYLNIRHLVGFPSSFDIVNFEDSNGENPLDSGKFHGFGSTTYGRFSCRNDVFFSKETSVFDVQSGRTKDGKIIPSHHLGHLEVMVFSVPFRTLTMLDDEMYNTWTHDRQQYYVSMYSPQHDITINKVWIYTHREDEIPQKYKSIVEIEESQFTNHIGARKRKVYR